MPNNMTDNKVTHKQIAEACDVTTATVSLALQGKKSRMSEKTYEKIVAAAKKLSEQRLTQKQIAEACDATKATVSLDLQSSPPSTIMESTLVRTNRLLINNEEVSLNHFFADSEGFKYTRLPADFARFTHNADAEIRINLASSQPYSVHPPQKVEIQEAKADSVAFKIKEPCGVAIRQDDAPWIFLRADEADAYPIPQGAKTGADFGIIPDSEELQSDVINAAIEHLSKGGGGTLRLEAGLYNISTINMCSGVTLYLDDGAHLKATLDAEVYPYDEDGILNKDQPPSLIPGPLRRVIYWHNCEDAAIIGKGMIDGNGSELRGKYLLKVGGQDTTRPLMNLMKFVHAKRCQIKGVTLFNSDFWNTHVLLSEDILFDGAQVINERPPAGWLSYVSEDYKDIWWNNTDGINPDSSQNIEINNCLYYTGDDCTAVKNTGTYRNELADIRNIHVHDNLMIGATPMKIGTETRGSVIENVIFERNHVAICSRPLAIEGKDGAKIQDITWRDITVAECNRPFDLELLRRGDHPNQTEFCNINRARIENVTIEKHANEGRYYECSIKGISPDHKVANSSIRNFMISGEKFGAETDYLRMNEYVEGFIFED